MATTRKGPAPFTADLPLAPLLEAYGGTVYDLAILAGKSRTAGCRAMELGGLTVNQADAWACAIGLHPCTVWGDAWWAASALESV